MNCIDLNEIYFKNEKYWINSKEDKEVAKEIAKQNEWHSLLYFAEYDALNNEYSEQLDNKERTKITFDEKPESFVSDFVKVDTAPIVRDTKEKKKIIGTKNVGYSSNRNKNNEETGKKGERIVYETLKKQGIKINWVSEYAYDEGVNPNGKASLGYDMYIDEEPGREFIEVKSSTVHKLILK